MILEVQVLSRAPPSVDKTSDPRNYAPDTVLNLAMKKSIALLLFVTLLFSGCSSSPQFTEFHGTGVFQGTGGELRTVDDIDFWENGEPDRKYKILGTLEEEHGHRGGHLSGLFRQDRDTAIAKGVRKHGGDAVIFVAKDQPPSDEDDFSGKKHQRFTLVVIKYLP